MSGGYLKDGRKPFITSPNSELTQARKVAGIAHCKTKEPLIDIWGERLQLRFPKAWEEKNRERGGLGGKLGHSRAPVYTRDFRKTQICLEPDACSEKT